MTMGVSLKLQIMQKLEMQVSRSIVVNWVHYGDAAAAKRQEDAKHSLMALGPEITALLLIMRDDFDDEAHVAAAEIYDGGMINPADLYPPRDSFDVTGERHLPYVKDLLDFDITSRWVGLMNSDIILTPKFKETWFKSKADVLLTKRTDIGALGEEPSLDNRLMDHSTDGILIKRAVWNRYRDDYPDYILGLAGWGYGTNLWARANSLRIEQMANHECLHVTHLKAAAKYPAGGKGRKINMKLYNNYAVKVGIERPSVMRKWDNETVYNMVLEKG